MTLPTDSDSPEQVPKKEALRLQNQSVLSLLDEVMAAVDKDVAFIEDKREPECKPGSYPTWVASVTAARYLENFGLSQDANLLRTEAGRFFHIISDYMLLVMSADMSQEELDVQKNFFGPFPSLPADPSIAEDFLLAKLAGCRLQGDIIQRQVKRIRGLLSEPDGGFIANDFQLKILAALDGCGLTKQKLANKILGGEGSRLYKPGGIMELMEAGKVANRRRLGYYRPDRPPPANVLN